MPLRAPTGLTGEEAKNWYREKNFIVCPVVLITSVNREGRVNAAVKTNFMTVRSMTQYVFNCSPQHHTYQNIMETKEFVINIPTEDIIGQILKAAMIIEKPCPLGVNEKEKAELTPIQSEKMKPPRVKECVAHYECQLDWHKDGFIMGKVVTVSVDQSFNERIDKNKMVVVGGGRTPESYGVVYETKKWPISFQ